MVRRRRVCSSLTRAEPQNEPLGYVDGASDADFSWVCDRAATIQSALPAGSPILVSSGGGTDLAISTGAWAMKCKNFDIVSVHSYDVRPPPLQCR